MADDTGPVVPFQHLLDLPVQILNNGSYTGYLRTMPRLDDRHKGMQELTIRFSRYQEAFTDQTIV